MSKSEKVFAVVVFDETNETDVVPTSWLTPNKTCWWPNYRSLTRIATAVKSAEVPSKENFKSYPARVLQTYSTYDVAKRQAKKAEITSELSSEGNTPPKPRRAKQSAAINIKQEYDGSSSEDERESIPLPKFPRLEEVPTDGSQFQQRLNNHQDYAERSVNENEGARFPVPQANYVQQSSTYSPQFQSIPYVAEMEHSTPPSFQQNFQSYMGYPPRPMGSDLTYNHYGTYRDIPSSSSNSVLQGATATGPIPNVTAQNESTFSGLDMNPKIPFRDESHHLPDHIHELSAKKHNQSSCRDSPFVKHPTPDNVTSGSQIDFQNWMIRNVTIMKAQMKQLQESLDVVLKNGIPTKNVNEFADITGVFKLPVKDVSQLHEIDAALVDGKKRESLVHHLSLIGGKDVSDCTRRILSALVCDQVSERFSWLGSRGEKLSFAKSFLKTLLFDAVRKNLIASNATDSQMEIVVKEWLKNSKKRLRPPVMRHGQSGESHQEEELN